MVFFPYAIAMLLMLLFCALATHNAVVGIRSSSGGRHVGNRISLVTLPLLGLISLVVLGGLTSVALQFVPRESEGSAVALGFVLVGLALLLDGWVILTALTLRRHTHDATS